jgi:hypothetical protein
MENQVNQINMNSKKHHANLIFSCMRTEIEAAFNAQEIDYGFQNYLNQWLYKNQYSIMLLLTNSTSQETQRLINLYLFACECPVCQRINSYLILVKEVFMH